MDAPSAVSMEVSMCVFCFLLAREKKNVEISKGVGKCESHQKGAEKAKGVKLVSKFHCIETRNRVTFDSCMYAMIDVHYKKTLSFTLLVE